MIFKNNNIARENDAEHLARARMMAYGIEVYAAELDIPPDVANEYAVYAVEIHT